MTLLPEVEAALRDGVRRDHHARGSHVGPRRSKRVDFARSRIWPALSMIVAALSLAALVTALLVDHGTTRRPTSPVRQGAAHPSLPSALRASFVSLRRPLTADDTLPNDIVSALAHEHITGVDPSLSRLLLATSTETIWLVPGPETTCIVARQPLLASRRVQDISSTCSADTAAEQRGIIFIPGGIIAGVLPDGSSNPSITLKDGSTMHLATNNDGAFAEQLDPRPTSLSYTGPDGTQNSLRIPPAINPRSCAPVQRSSPLTPQLLRCKA